MVLLAIDLIFQKIMVNEAIGIKIIGGPPPIVNQIRLGDARDAWTGCVLTVRAADAWFFKRNNLTFFASWFL